MELCRPSPCYCHCPTHGLPLGSTTGLVTQLLYPKGKNLSQSVLNLYQRDIFPPDALSCFWSLFWRLSQCGTPTDSIKASGGRETGASETADCHYIICSLPWNIKVITNWMLLERLIKQQAKKIFLDLTGSTLTYLHLKHLSMCKEFSCI